MAEAEKEKEQGAVAVTEREGDFGRNNGGDQDQARRWGLWNGAGRHAGLFG